MTSSLEGSPAKAKEAPSPYEVRLAQLDTNEWPHWSCRIPLWLLQCFSMANLRTVPYCVTLPTKLKNGFKIFVSTKWTMRHLLGVDWQRPQFLSLWPFPFCGYLLAIFLTPTYKTMNTWEIVSQTVLTLIWPESSTIIWKALPTCLIQLHIFYLTLETIQFLLHTFK